MGSGGRYGAGFELDQERLEGLCVRVLTRQRDDGVFSAGRNLEGFVVLGPDDSNVDVLAKKRHSTECYIPEPENPHTGVFKVDGLVSG